MSASTALAAEQVHYRTVAVGDVKVFYREAGPKNAPDVLLLHGWGASSFVFRNLIPVLATKYHVVASDLPGFGLTEAPLRSQFKYDFEHLAAVVDRFTEIEHLDHYAVYVFDYGAPTGYRLAVRHPDRITAIISQNGNAYAEGLSQDWDPIKRYWAEPTQKNRDALRGFLTLKMQKWQYEQGTPNPSLIEPEAYLSGTATLLFLNCCMHFDFRWSSSRACARTPGCSTRPVPRRQARPRAPQGQAPAAAARAPHRPGHALAAGGPGQPDHLAQRGLDRIHPRHRPLAPWRQADCADPMGGAAEGSARVARGMAAQGLVRYPDGRHEPEAFLCTDTEANPRDVLDCYNRRWAIETTYEESHTHLGVETQRQWSDSAIFRTKPLLLGLYTAVALYTHQNADRLALSPRRAAWYPKPAPTFSNALARLGQHLWLERIVTSAVTADMTEPISPAIRGILEAVCYAP